MPHRVREGKTSPAGLGRGNMPLRVRKGKTCPEGLGRGNMHWLG